MSTLAVLLRCAGRALLRSCSSMPRETTMVVGPRRLYYSSARPEHGKNVIKPAEQGIFLKIDEVDRALERRGVMLKEILEEVKRQRIIRTRCRLTFFGASILGGAIYVKRHFFSESQDHQDGESSKPSLSIASSA